MDTFNEKYSNGELEHAIGCEELSINIYSAKVLTITPGGDGFTIEYYNYQLKDDNGYLRIDISKEDAEMIMKYLEWQIKLKI